VVKNDGVISARLGTVAMAAGERMTLNFGGNALLDVTIDKGAYNALVANRKLIVADGGRVILSAQTADQIMSAQVNNTGIIQARTLADLTGGHEASGTVQVGQIQLLAKDGTVNVGGTLDASAPKGGKGGSIETSGKTVQVASTAHITTRAASGQNGTWLIDPTDFTISGGAGALTGSGIGATTLAAELANGNVSIVTSSASNGTDMGDLNVNAPVTWTSGNNLTLAAFNDINVNAPVTWSAGTLTLSAGKDVFVNNVMTATGTASFVSNYGSTINTDGSISSTATAGTNADGTSYGLYTSFGGYGYDFTGKLNFSGSGSVSLNKESYTVINSVGDLLAAAQPSNMDKNYILGSDQTIYWSNAAYGAKLPIGTELNPYEGKFNGLGHSVDIEYNDSNPANGFFGQVGPNSSISNLGSYYGISITGDGSFNPVGNLVNINYGKITNVFSYNGSLSTGAIVVYGGLVGENFGIIDNAYVDSGGLQQASYAGVTSYGGFVGINEAGGSINNSFVLGGLLGKNGNIAQNTSMRIGGFAGDNDGTIGNSYSYNVTIASGRGNHAYAGGFVGYNTGIIENAYSAGGRLNGFSGNGSYSSDYAGGGFAGLNTGTISNSYTATPVTLIGTAGLIASGGFVGINTDGTKTGTVNNSYYDTSLTTLSTDAGGATGLSGTDATLLAAYHFDPTVWGSSANGHPILRTIPVYSETTTTTFTYGRTLSSMRGSFKFFGLQWGDTATTTPPLSVSDCIVATSCYADAGTYSLAGVTAGLSDYAKIFDSTFTINPKTLSISGVVENKVYDGTTEATIDNTVANGGLVGLVGSETLNIAYNSAQFADANAGNGKNVNLTYVLSNGANGGLASNYLIVNPVVSANITPKEISATYSVSDKVYDGTTSANINVSDVMGVLSGDNVTASASGTFSSANAGVNIPVTISGSLSGSSAGNYTLATLPTTDAASITPRVVSISGVKLYNGQNSVTASDLQISNLVAGDSVTLTGQVGLSGSTVGSQTINSFSDLAIENSNNYTLQGASGVVSIIDAALPVLSQTKSDGISLSNPDANSLTVTTTEPKSIIEWNSFNISNGYSVTFDQKAGSNSVTLNRVMGGDQSYIAGDLSSNGRLFFINPAGIIFSNAATVNAGGILASTQDITDEDFQAGTYLFGNNSATGSLNVSGSITVEDDSYVALLGNGIINNATITAPGGNIVFAGGEGVSLIFDTNGHLSDASVATPDKTVSVGGTLDISSMSGNGGTIKSFGPLFVTNTLNILSDGAAGYNNGQWLWQSDGTVLIGSGGVSGSALSKILSTIDGKVISTSGDINITDPVSWSSHMLTLASAGDINVSNVLTATGTASLTASYGSNVLTKYPSTSMGNGGMSIAFEAPILTIHGIHTAYGKNSDGTNNDTFSGKIDFNSTGTVQLGVTGQALQSYTVINSASDLQAINNSILNMNQNYVLGSDIDLTGVTNWAPIGYDISGINYAYNGIFNGFGHQISNLTSNIGGLFLVINNSTDMVSPAVYNTGITNIDISSQNAAAYNIEVYQGANGWQNEIYDSIIGALAGVSGGVIDHVFTTGNIDVAVANDGYAEVGGMFGGTSGYVNDSYANVNVNSSNFYYTGGFTGNLTGYVTNSYASGNVTATQTSALTSTLVRYTGGFAGQVGGAVVNSSASGNVNGVGYVGGFTGIGSVDTANIYSSSASGKVLLDDTSPYVNASRDYAGGFIGINWGNIFYSSSSGRVQSVSGSTDQLGGFAGSTVAQLGAMSIMNYWNVDTSGLSDDGAGNGIPSGMGMGSTPILDAYNAEFGTHLTAAQFHGGAIGLSATDFNTVQSQQVTNTSSAVTGLQSVLDGKLATGQPIPTNTGGNNTTGGNDTGDSGTNSGSGGSGGSTTGGGTTGGNTNPGGDNPSTPATPPTTPVTPPSTPVTPQATPNAPLANIERLPPEQRQAVRAMGNIAAANTVLSQAQPMPVASGMVGALAMAAEQPPLADHITIEEPPATHLAASQPQDRRRPAPEAKPSSRATEKASAYDASIRSIEVDGQRFDLQATPKTHTGKRH
jgi:filamentous hemagglutinin family protein